MGEQTALPPFVLQLPSNMRPEWKWRTDAAAFYEWNWKKGSGEGKEWADACMRARTHTHVLSLAAVAVLPPSRVKVESSCASKMWWSLGSNTRSTKQTLLTPPLLLQILRQRIYSKYKTNVFSSWRQNKRWENIIYSMLKSSKQLDSNIAPVVSFKPMFCA